MFTIFKRPKPRYKIGQLVYVPVSASSPHNQTEHYLFIRRRKWVKENSTDFRWYWSYSGSRVDIHEGFLRKYTDPSPFSSRDEYPENRLGRFVF